MNILAHSHTPNEETHRSQFGFNFGVYLLSLFPMCSLISLWSVWPFLVGPWSVSTTRIHISMVSINHKDAQAYGQYPPQGYTSLWSVSTTRMPKCMVSIHHKDTQAIHNQFFKAMVQQQQHGKGQPAYITWKLQNSYMRIIIFVVCKDISKSVKNLLCSVWFLLVRDPIIQRSRALMLCWCG